MTLLRELRVAWAAGAHGAVILGLFAMGMERAWILLGNPRQGWSGRLNPLHDLGMASEADVAKNNSR